MGVFVSGGGGCVSVWLSVGVPLFFFVVVVFFFYGVPLFGVGVGEEGRRTGCNKFYLT